MVTYKITTPHNGCIQYTQSGKDLYCSILDKFNIEYKIEEIAPTKENDIPHSDIRRMESEGVYEEKFDKPNFSSDSQSTTYFNEEWNSTSTDKSIIPTYVENDERMDIIGQNGNDGLHYDWKDESDDENPKDIQDWEETPFGKAHKKFTTNMSDFDDDEAYEDGVDERPIKKETEYNDDEFDY